MTDGQDSVLEETKDQSEEPSNPRDSKKAVGKVSALVRADNHWENTLEVSGGASLEDHDPQVNLSLGNDGQIHNSIIQASMDPGTARELAQTLQQKADYAERYAKHQRLEEEDGKQAAVSPSR